MKIRHLLVVLTFLWCVIHAAVASAYRPGRDGPWSESEYRARCKGEKGVKQSYREEFERHRHDRSNSRYYSPVPAGAEEAAARYEAARQEARQQPLKDALTRLVAGTDTPADRDLVSRWRSERRADAVSPSITAMNLYGVPATDVGLEHLKGLTDLKTLVLSGTKITDAGLEHLKGLPQLQTLYLSGTQITDVGVEHLKGLPQLRWVNLSGARVTDAGVNELEKALPNVVIF